MKATVFSLFIMMILSFVSCSKDDDVVASTETDQLLSKVVGTWYVESITNNEGQQEITPGDVVVVFSKDYKYSIKYFDTPTRTGTYKVTGKNTIVGQSADEDGALTDTFEFTSFSGNKATINYKSQQGSDTENMVIVSVKQ